MISKVKIKYIQSLQEKKKRSAEKLFVVEGKKSLLEIMNSSFQIMELYVTKDFWGGIEYSLFPNIENIFVISQNELDFLSFLMKNNAGIAIVRMPEASFFLPHTDEWSILLDSISDPGNIGTIIRIADWYNIKKIYASPDTTDIFSPKVVQACMGSLTRVHFFYTPLMPLLEQKQYTIYGATLDGDSLHTTVFEKKGMLLVGNESKGISKELIPFIDKKITIPKFGNAESLNVAVATGIICDAFMR